MRRAFAAVLLCSCAAQIDEPAVGSGPTSLLTMITSPRAIADVEIALVWQSFGDAKISEGQFATRSSAPATLSLNISSAPPPYLVSTIRSNGTVTDVYAVAYLAAVASGTQYGRAIDDKIIGGDVDHLVVNLPNPVAAKSSLSYLLRGTPGAGAHVYRVRHLTAQQRKARQDCLTSLREPPLSEIFDICGGDATDDFVPIERESNEVLQVQIVDDPQTLVFPHLTP
jgi:hypothetical protein